MIIREARPDDVENYRELRLTALKESPTSFGADYDQSLTLPPSHWQGRLTIDEQQCLYFATESDQLVGMTGVFREASPKRSHYAMIWGVYVRPEARGQRLADQMINLCLDWARTHEALYARLSVNASNARAISCYLRCGFRVYGVEPAGILWEGMYYDELLMVRNL
jgi:RimJ/RimL family protein N-acetyltransferase